MDSVSQFALGAAVGVAVMGRRTAVWKAALWGGFAGTLPDLDVLIDHGDPLANMVNHRGASHALFYLSLLAPLLAAIPWRLHGREAYRRWWLAMWLALVTHPLLDAFTVYGTRLLLPFSDHAFAVGSVFIIDPLYTLPLLFGLGLTLLWRDARGLRANAAGLALSSAYLGWSVFAQAQVAAVAEASRPPGMEASTARLLITPTPFNTLLWRVVWMDDTHYHEGFRSLLDAGAHMQFDRFPVGRALQAQLAEPAPANALMRFAQGFVRLHEREGQVLLTDLRMGQEPHYVFSFVIAERPAGAQQASPIRPQQVGSRGDAGAGLRWVWRRLQGEVLPPPR